MTSPHRPLAQPPKTATTFSNNTPTNPKTPLPPPPPSPTATQPQPSPMPLPPWVEKRLAGLPAEMAAPLRQRLENLAYLQSMAEGLRQPIQELVVALMVQAEDQMQVLRSEANLDAAVKQLVGLGCSPPPR